MNEKNFEYLKDNIKYLGFGETLTNALQAQLKGGTPDFQLTYETQINKKAFAAVLNFRKSDNTDMYFFNSYHATLQRSNGEVVDQAFYLNNGKGITAKEGYNLLEGRAVFKELSNKAGESYKAWVQLDFDKRDKQGNHEVKQYHEAYWYDLKASLSRYAITDLDGGDREKALLQSLQKGNIQAVAVGNDVGVSKMFVEANPQYKTITFYSSDMKRLPKESLEQYIKADRTQGQASTQEQKQDVSAEGKQKTSKNPDDQKPSKSRSKSRSAGI
jgi:hypothetical protein